MLVGMIHQTKDRMKKTLTLFISLLFSVLSYGQSNELTDKEKLKLYPDKEKVSPFHNDWTQNNYPKRIDLFRDNPLEKGDIVFIGNSITQQGADWSEKFGIAHIRNRGIAGDVTDGVLMRLDEVVFFQPKAVFILIGINDLFSLHYEDGDKRFSYKKLVPSTKYVANNIVKIARIIQRKSPNTKIFVRTVLPTRRDFLKDDIVSLNELIRKNESRGYYTLIDLYHQFVDDNGDMMKELTKDGVHLNEDGYENWVKFEKLILESL